MASRRLDEEAIFHVARKIADPDAQAEYLDQICAGDQALRERVEALLQVHETEHNFLKSVEPGPATTAVMTPPQEHPGTTIGRYKLMEQIGEGGMGVVFVAKQERPIRRNVALKLIKPGMDSKAIVTRFEAERQALAMMDHPHIARVLDAGTTESGRPYFAMELVRGIPITEYCDKNKLTIRERLELFIQVCHAIQHAHQKGIIHRDIKPSNVLVTLHDGQPVPKVIDFGVAKALNMRLSETTLYTEHRQIVGTLLYMSPEQAEMSELGIDIRSDIYSLGVLLYELLTGTTPFTQVELNKAGFDQQRRMICDQEPPRASVRISSLGDTATVVAEHRRTDPTRLNHSVRGDLDWILLKALEKDRSRRYDSTGAFATDIERHLNDLPIVARPPSLTYSLIKLAKRHTGAVISSIVIVASVLSGLAGTSWFAYQERKMAIEATIARQESDADRQALRDKQSELERELYYGNMNLANSYWQDGSLADCEQRLESCTPRLRNWEWSYLKRLCHLQLATLRAHSDWVTSIAVSPDGSTVVTASADNTLRIWDLAHRSLIRTLSGHKDTVRTVVFHPDGRRVISGSHDHTIKLWSIDSEQCLATLDGHQDNIWGIAASPDGQIVVSASSDKTVRIWDIASCSEVRRVDLEFVPNSVAISPDGQTLAVGSEEKTLLYSTTTMAHTPGALGGTYNNCLQFSRDGSRLVTGGMSPAVWSIASGSPLFTLEGHAMKVHQAVYSPDGHTIATCSADQRIILWDADTGAQLSVLRGHGKASLTVAFSRDSATLISGSNDHTIKLWKVDEIRHEVSIAAHTKEVTSLAFSSNGLYVLTAGKDGSIGLWDSATGSRVRQFEDDPNSPINSASLDYAGQLVATASADGTISIYDVRTGNRTFSLEGHVGGTQSVVFHPDGRMLASVGEDSAVRLWDVEHRRLAADLNHNERRPMRVAFSRDGRWLAAGGFRSFGLWDVANRRPLWIKQDKQDEVYSLAFDDENDRIVLARGNADVEIHSLRDGELLRKFRVCPDEVRGACLLPHHERLVTGGTGGRVGLWDYENERNCLEIRADPSLVLAVAASPDGRRIAAALPNGVLKIWEAPSIAPTITFPSTR